MEVERVILSAPEHPQLGWCEMHAQIEDGPVVAVLWFDFSALAYKPAAADGVLDLEPRVEEEITGWCYWLVGAEKPSAHDPRLSVASAIRLGDFEGGGSPPEAKELLRWALRDAPEPPTWDRAESLRLIERKLDSSQEIWLDPPPPLPAEGP